MRSILKRLRTATLTTTPGSQVHPPGQGSPIPHSRNRRHPPRWSLPWQACHRPQAPRAGCPPRHWSLQSQRCSPPKGERPVRHCDLDQGGHCGRRRLRREEGLRGRLLHQGQGFQEDGRGRFLQAGRGPGGGFNGIAETRTQANSAQKKETSKDRVADQKAVDKALLATIKKEAHLIDYLSSTFSLRSSDRPHAMAF